MYTKNRARSASVMMRILKFKIIFNEKNSKHKKIILLINFIFAQTYFLIASSQNFKNDAILINHGSVFEEKDSLQDNRFLFLKLN